MIWLRHFFILFTLILVLGCKADLPDPKDEDPVEGVKTIRELVEEVFPGGNVYIGSASHHRLLETESVTILDREFSYVTPANDFKQSYIHPEPGKYQYEQADDWVQHCQENNQVIRLHAPISPQCSNWAREDNRTPQELSTMLDEYMTALCNRYNGIENILWLDVVNETIDKANGDWFGPKPGTSAWENPWTIIGFDETHELRPPLYIKQAFDIANELAPDIKQIINQHGALEKHSWDKMKALVEYLREKGVRVDGLGWQAHLDLGWEKIPGNLEYLAEIIQWCHAINLEFHITQFNVWLRDGDEGKIHSQAATFKEITKVMLDNRKTGIVGINFWHVRANDTANKDRDGCLWTDDYMAKPAYYEIIELLKSYRNFD